MPPADEYLMDYYTRIEATSDVEILENIVREVTDDRKLTRSQAAKLLDALTYKVGLLRETPKDPDLLEELAKAGRTTIEKHFGIDPSTRQAPAAVEVRAPEKPATSKSITLAEGFTLQDLDAGVKEAKLKAKESLVVKDAAELCHVPPGFIIIFEDPASGRQHPYITKEGMLWKLRDRGFRSVDVEIVPDPDNAGGFLGTAKIVPNLQEKDYDLLQVLAQGGEHDVFLQVYNDLQRPTVSHSSANKGNLKPKQQAWAREMCETRAILRAARVFTGCGLATVEEDSDVQEAKP